MATFLSRLRRTVVSLDVRELTRPSPFLREGLVSSRTSSETIVLLNLLRNVATYSLGKLNDRVEIYSIQSENSCLS